MIIPRWRGGAAANYITEKANDGVEIVWGGPPHYEPDHPDFFYCAGQDVICGIIIRAHKNQVSKDFILATRNKPEVFKSIQDVKLKKIGNAIQGEIVK